MRVAFQGAMGAYSEVAAKRIFGKQCVCVPCTHFEQVFEFVKTGKVNRGVIPIENTLAGSIHQNYDLLQKYKLKIIKETHLRIEHVLMCNRSDTAKTLTKIISHPQALSQCSDYFSKHKSIEASAFYDTAGAAEHISKNKPDHTGAIASSLAAARYRLKVLKRNMENNHQNFTRFLGISTKDFTGKPRGRYKTSISFAPKRNETGILFKMLGIFALRSINLLKIESRPIPGRAFEYVFYLDFEGSPSEKKCGRAIEHLQDMAAVFELFGTYPAGKRTYIEQ